MNESRKQEPRRPDCVTEVRMGNTVLVVSGYFKKDAASTFIILSAAVASIRADDKPALEKSS